MRVKDKVGLSHIDQIVSEWQTSMLELQRHSSIFGDTVVQFMKDDLDLIEVIFDKASVRLRNIVLARYEQYFVRLHEVLDTHRTLYSAYGRLFLSAYCTCELFLLHACSHQNHITWIPVNPPSTGYSVEYLDFEMECLKLLKIQNSKIKIQA